MGVDTQMRYNPNKSIYNDYYVPAQLEFAPRTPYDANVLNLRRNLLAKYCAGKDVLDLCCGSGSYLIDVVQSVKTAVGLDFSRSMLDAAAERIGPFRASGTVSLVEGDARSLPFADESFDTVFSIASLYHVPEVQRAIAETARVLRPNGVAILDLGNATSLATMTNALSHRMYGWAKSFAIPYRDIVEVISKSGLTIEEHQAFQILPLFGPRLVQLLLPFSASVFKYPLGLRVRGRLLDSIICSAPLLRRLAYRHLFVLRKPEHG
jgi:SAM-dependent methyltransferase